MKAIVCKVCGYIALNGETPENCPVCWAPKTSFEEREDAINIPKDPANLEGGEQKHVPKISKMECGLIEGSCVDIHVLMGEVIHPMEAAHFITHVDFYVNKEYVARMLLTPGCQPAVSLHLKKTEGRISVIENCNQHGNWIAEMDL